MRLRQIHIKNITTSYYIKILIIIMSTYCTRGTRATLLVSLKEASKLKAGRMITKRTKLGFHSFGLRIETGLSQKLTPYRRLSYQQYKDVGRAVARSVNGRVARAAGRGFERGLAHDSHRGISLIFFRYR